MSFKPPYQYITASSLASLLKSTSPVSVSASASTSASSNSPPGSRTDVAIIDVRDDDFEGGNIVGCINVPSTEFPQRVEGLVEQLKDASTVVFHCSLSQQRGPKAARIYSEARGAAAIHSNIVQVPTLQSTTAVGQQDDDGSQTRMPAERGTQQQQQQQQQEGGGGQAIYVLRDGFAHFGQLYKRDAQLVEKYDEEAWAWR